MSLKLINTSAMFECIDHFCGQRFDMRDYIKFALQNFNHKIRVEIILDRCYEGVNE